MIHYERCGCNAAILAWSKGALKDWRETHRHDPQHEEQPSIEELYSITDVGVDLPLGFAPEPANGWYDDKVINVT